MAGSRTGTAAWFKVRDERRRIALDEGMYNCPSCGVALDWEYPGRPNSAEVDHIIPHARGGEDVIENTRILCRFENQSRGGKEGRAKQLKPKRVELTTTANW